MPHRSDAAYFQKRAAASRVAAAGSTVRGAILVHRQMASEYDRLSKNAAANDVAGDDIPTPDGA